MNKLDLAQAPLLLFQWLAQTLIDTFSTRICETHCVWPIDVQAMQDGMPPDHIFL
jgi:hypothetical protein